MDSGGFLRDALYFGGLLVGIIMVIFGGIFPVQVLGMAFVVACLIMGPAELGK